MDFENDSGRETGDDGADSDADDAIVALAGMNVRQGNPQGMFHCKLLPSLCLALRTTLKMVHL